MTESEWNECADPQKMLEFLRGKASDRKCRLFLVSCARAAWSSIADEECRKGIETAERYADGLVTETQLRQIDSVIFQGFSDRHSDWVISQTDVPLLPRRQITFPEVLAWGHSVCTTSVTKPGFDGLLGRNAWVHYGSQLTEKVQPRLIREIIGNPFRPITLDPSWLTPTVRHLVDAIYQERAFDRLPILADALDEAGCDNADILGHCRSGGEHVRGCWALDLVLGKQ
jgi:hypothetical protein